MRRKTRIETLEVVLDSLVTLLYKKRIITKGELMKQVMRNGKVKIEEVSIFGRQFK